MKNINLSELTLENVGQWPMSVKIGMTGVMSLVLILLGYWVIVKRNFEEHDVLQAQEYTLRQEFEQKQHLAANLQAYHNQLRLMDERFGTMLQELPAENEMPGLLEDISKTGIASGLTFQSFAPEPEVIHDFYIELPIKIAVIGNYHQLAVFVSHVAEMNRIVTLHDFSIELMPQDKDKKTMSDLLIMRLTAKIYRYRALQ